MNPPPPPPPAWQTIWGGSSPQNNQRFYMIFGSDLMIDLKLIEVIFWKNGPECDGTHAEEEKEEEEEWRVGWGG